MRVSDLQSLLLRHKPDIAHFGGHGSQSSEIILEDPSGTKHPVPARALRTLFSVLKDNIRCVVLNACHSKQQAEGIAEHIDCVIGMSQAIGDSAAVSFSSAFYQALGFGRDINTAFDLGCIQIDLERLKEQDIPKLIALKGNPEEVVFCA
ncbi:MAG: CHAT domain-containing protein [bacterium]|nr:CHAT domain-containing protein [bacterium]